MNNYLIPANSKKGQLYFNLFRVEDLVVLLIGGLITLVLVFAISGDSLLTMALKLMPLGIAVLLVMPIAYYHNVMVFIKEIASAPALSAAMAMSAIFVTLGLSFMITGCFAIFLILFVMS